MICIISSGAKIAPSLKTKGEITMRTMKIYDHENARKNHKFLNKIRNTKKMSAGQLIAEGEALWRETVRREKMAKARKRKLKKIAEANAEKAKAE